MDWTVYSSDLNHIEHVWDNLRRRIAAHLHHPENIQQLKQMLIEEWAFLPQEMLHQLVLRMRRRCEATIALLGSSGHSRVRKKDVGPVTAHDLEKMIQKSEETDSFHLQSVRGRKRVNSTVVEEMILAVQEKSSRDFQLCSAWGIAPTLDTHVSTLHKILRNILHCYPYKISHVEELLLSDLPLNGYINKQNCRIWSEANPQVYVETPLHPEKLTVWCDIWAGGFLLQKR
ncbi:DUF4817 domain-containing protein [Trichonephila clavipes]|nr:DUF4817 domain-containing protein [Trichonephila clavipes]